MLIFFGAMTLGWPMCVIKSNRVVVDMPLSLLHFVHKTFVVSAQPIRTRHFITGSMSSLHYDGRQSAAVTLVGPFFPLFDSTFRYAGVYTAVAVTAVMSSCS